MVPLSGGGDVYGMPPYGLRRWRGLGRRRGRGGRCGVSLHPPAADDRGQGPLRLVRILLLGRRRADAGTGPAGQIIISLEVSPWHPRHERNPPQPKKALAEILFTLSGIITFLIPVVTKAACPMEFILSGIIDELHPRIKIPVSFSIIQLFSE